MELWKIIGAWGAVALLPLICGIATPTPEALCPQVPNLIPSDGDCEEFCGRAELDELLRVICDENSWMYLTEAQLEEGLGLALNPGDVGPANTVTCIASGGAYVSNDPNVMGLLSTAAYWVDGETLWDKYYPGETPTGNTICWAEYAYASTIGDKTFDERITDLLDLTTNKLIDDNIILQCCEDSSAIGCSKYDDWSARISQISAEVGEGQSYCESERPCYAQASFTLFGETTAYEWTTALETACMNNCEYMRDTYQYDADGESVTGCEEDSTCWLTAYVDFMTGDGYGDMDVNTDCNPIVITYTDPGSGPTDVEIDNLFCETLKDCPIIQEVLAEQ